MTDRTDARPSIHRRLVGFLVCVLLLVVVAAASLTYWGALNAANDAYDRGLLDPALDIAQNLIMEAGVPSLDLPLKAQEALVYDQEDQVFFQVRAPDLGVVAGVPDLPAPSALTGADPRFSDGTYHGSSIRIVSLRTPAGFVVQVGETKRKRYRLAGELLLAELVPTLLVALAAIVLAWLGVTHGLAPLERLRKELSRRSPHDLRPVSDPSVPVEIAPVVDAFDDLLSQLRNASAMQRRFLANAAHQLRTPLAGLQMHLELLLRRDHVPEVRAELTELLGATTRAAHLANRLLTLAKAESAADEERTPVAVDLHDVADRAARQWVPLAIQRGIDLGFSLEHVEIVGDALLLPELLGNLIDNALLYTPAGGTVTVSCGIEDGRPCLAVEDTGRGIPEAERGHVLERFYRVAGTPGDGSGLGLAIVREVVDRHGAAMRIETPPTGHGTRFTVLFRPFGLPDG
ncbi:MAG: sensor histidine kinase [Betaproteobacteria bacterium]